MIALLGPSGCGKTTLLKSIAGLIPHYKGKIYVGNKEISNLSPQKRNTALVFQNYALFPHMTVKENIIYGLKVKKIKSKEANEKADNILEIVKLEGYQDRKVHELSGGQQQRVALARALVIEPSVLLFDEPLSNLDEKLRVSMRKEIRRIQQEFGITSVYVTHDQEEAMSIADEIVIMKNGDIQQISNPNDAYFFPKNEFVAEFMGTANIFELEDKHKNSEIIEYNLWDEKLEIRIDKNIKGRDIENPKSFMFRPQNIDFNIDGKFKGEVKWVEILGTIMKITLDVNGKEIIAAKINDNKENLKKGDTVNFNVDTDKIVLLEQ